MTVDPVRHASRTALRAWLDTHRRQIRFAAILAAIALVFFVIGATAPKFVMPYACKVYG